MQQVRSGGRYRFTGWKDRLTGRKNRGKQSFLTRFVNAETTVGAYLYDMSTVFVARLCLDRRAKSTFCMSEISNSSFADYTVARLYDCRYALYSFLCIALTNVALSLPVCQRQCETGSNAPYLRL